MSASGMMPARSESPVAAKMRMATSEANSYGLGSMNTNAPETAVSQSNPARNRSTGMPAGAAGARPSAVTLTLRILTLRYELTPVARMERSGMRDPGFPLAFAGGHPG